MEQHILGNVCKMANDAIDSQLSSNHFVNFDYRFLNVNFRYFTMFWPAITTKR